MTSKATLLLRITKVEGDAPEGSLSFGFRRMVGARKLPRNNPEILRSIDILVGRLESYALEGTNNMRSAC